MESSSPEQTQLDLRRCVTLWTQSFNKSEQARARLAALGITDLALLGRLQCGYAYPKLLEILSSDENVKARLVALGVLTPKGRDRFPDSITFPVLSADGQIITVIFIREDGRLETLSSRLTPPWNLQAGKSASNLYVAPSILDALALMVTDETHVIAVFPEQGGFDPVPLERWGVQKLTIVHGDTPAALNEVEALRKMIGKYPSTVITLNGVHGANAMLLCKGATGLSEALIKGAHGLSALHVPGMRPLPGGLTLISGNRKYEVRGLQASPTRLKATIRIERSGPPHVDTVDLYQARARRQFVIEVIRLTEETADTIEADMVKLLAACELRAAQPDLDSTHAADNAMPEADFREAEAMANDPKLVETIIEDYERCGLVGERVNKVIMYLSMTSRKMARPISTMTISSPGSGKSAQQEATAAFCPPEDLIKISNLSPKALFHRDKNSLRHKFLSLEEGVGVEAASYALRILISAGELVTEVAGKDPTSGRLVSMRNHVQGPVAISLTTTSPRTDPETKTRFFLLSADESPQQTDAILEIQRRHQKMEGLELPAIRSAICRRHHAFQRLLQPLHVINPLVDRLAGLSNRLTARRDHLKLIGLVNAVAFLRQRQKTVKQYHKINYIEVDEADLKIASGLVRELFSPANAEISRPARELLVVLDAMRTAAREAGALPAHGEEFLFTRREVREYARWERTRVHRYLRELLDLELVLRDRNRRGITDRYLLAWNGDLTFGQTDRILPFDTTGEGGNPQTAA